jgi:hypothetical protein
MIRLVLQALLVAATGLSLAARAGQPSDLRLVPFPKDVALQTGQFDLQPTLVLEAPAGQAGILARLLNEELQRAGLGPVRVREKRDSTNYFRLARDGGPGATGPLPDEDGPESYRLEVTTNQALCTASSPAGLFYGLQTLGQLIRANRHETAIPSLRIKDRPSLRWRCFQDDMTRGPSSKLDTLEYEAALGAQLKLNLMTFYMEYQFAFSKHPKIGPPSGSLTPEELAALVAFARPMHLDILGNQQSFGHFGEILKHPEYAPLRETADVLSPVKEESYRLLDELYSEVCPLLPFPWFNVCCDETWGLGTGPSKELAAKIGVGGVYVRHIQRVHDLLAGHHKRMMMWGDIILQHPGNLKDIPKDTIMLTWGYDARANFEDQIIPFARSGYEFFVCPGVNNWSRILPDFGVATTNIQHFVRDGVRHGALGMLNTDWEDDGEAINAVKWHADAWAAECAWNASATSPELFNRRVGAVLFGEKGDHFGQAIELLARTHRLNGMQGMLNSRFWEQDFAPRSSPAAVRTSASNLLAVVRPAIAHLEACQREAVANQAILQALLFGAHRMERIGLRMLDGLQAAQLYDQAWETSAGRSEKPAPLDVPSLLARVETLARTNRDAHEALGKQFAALWLSESKPYALEWTMKRYTNTVNWYDNLLGKLSLAHTAAAAGRPLPQPQELGLALPEMFARRSRPHEVVKTPLAPDAAWAEPSATHRLGLVVQAGAVDRYELPVEVEVTLTAELSSRPIRAFQLPTGDRPREVLAQLDPAGPAGKARLVLILSGPITRATQTAIHVYLGLAASPNPPSEAASTREAPKGMRWIENDKVRLLLGPEGSHIYRWEVKAAEGRDLTEPGDSGWAGFCDLGTHRTVPYQLDCLARGPALVRYQCIDPAGHTKTISLYGGTSWLEVMVGDPTRLFWNFDDPRNFAADGPTPGTYLFSNGATGPVGRQTDGLSAQIKAHDVLWSIKFNRDKLALGMATPETAALHEVAPGSAAGGVGIEGSPAASHFVVFAGRLDYEPAETMNRLRQTLDLKNQPAVVLHVLQSR